MRKTGFIKAAITLGIMAMASVLGSQISFAGQTGNSLKATVKCKSGVITAPANCKENGGKK